MFVNLFIHSRNRYDKLVSELSVFRILVRNMSTVNVKIDNRARGSGVAATKLTAYAMYGIGLALSYIYNAYLYIPHINKTIPLSCLWT